MQMPGNLLNIFTVYWAIELCRHQLNVSVGMWRWYVLNRFWAFRAFQSLSIFLVLHPRHAHLRCGNPCFVIADFHFWWWENFNWMLDSNQREFFFFYSFNVTNSNLIMNKIMEKHWLGTETKNRFGDTHGHNARGGTSSAIILMFVQFAFTKWHSMWVNQINVQLKRRFSTKSSWTRICTSLVLLFCVSWKLKFYFKKMRQFITSYLIWNSQQRNTKPNIIEWYL